MLVLDGVAVNRREFLVAVVRMTVVAAVAPQLLLPTRSNASRAVPLLKKEPVYDQWYEVTPRLDVWIYLVIHEDGRHELVTWKRKIGRFSRSSSGVTTPVKFTA